MAQGEPRPRHDRQAGKITRLGGRTGTHISKQDDTLGDSERQTIAYIKRVLCSGKAGTSSITIDATPLNELLPPLTSSNELDVQLYAIIAIILNQFVNSWYAQITNDRAFTDEVLNIIAHCTRGVEQQFKHIDLEVLLLDELPALLLAHIDAVNVAFSAVSDQRSGDNARLIFHSLRPSQATSPVPSTPSDLELQKENEIAWCQLLVSRILPLVLPPEDLQNPCLYVLVSEIFSQAILFNAVCERASEAWVIWEGVTKLIHILLRPIPTQQIPADESNDASSISKLEEFGLLSSAETKSHVNQLNTVPRGRLETISHIFWTVLYIVSTAWLLLRSLVRGLMHASSLPARPAQHIKSKTSNKLSLTAVEPNDDPTSGSPPPVVGMRIWSCIARLISLDHRMPWLFGLISLVQWMALKGPGQICQPNGAVDRLISSKIHQKLLHPTQLPRLLQGIHSALFPNNALGPARQPPTSAAEAAQIKRTCAQTILDALPRLVRNHYFATKDLNLMRQDIERTVLDLFEDEYINRCFVVKAVELFAVRLFPELEEEEGADGD